MHFQLLLALAATAMAANRVPQKVTFSAAGAADVVGNAIGCAHITPAGQSPQLACVKHVFTNGFTVNVKDEATKNATLCSIAGSQGACGPAGVNATVDLTGGTGEAPAASGPGGTTNLTAADLVNKPIGKREIAWEA